MCTSTFSGLVDSYGRHSYSTQSAYCIATPSLWQNTRVHNNIEHGEMRVYFGVPRSLLSTYIAQGSGDNFMATVMPLVELFEFRRCRGKLRCTEVGIAIRATACMTAPPQQPIPLRSGTFVVRSTSSPARRDSYERCGKATSLLYDGESSVSGAHISRRIRRCCSLGRANAA